MSNIIHKVVAKLSNRGATAIESEQHRLQNQLQQLESTIRLWVLQNPSSNLCDRIPGTWTSGKCAHTNQIIVLPGDNPLGYLTCVECPQNLCPTCTTSTLIEAWTKSGSDLRKDFWDGEMSARLLTDLPIAHVCSTCGLSWRAVITKVTKAYENAEMVEWGSVEECVCGARPSKRNKWHAYLINGGKPSHERPQIRKLEDLELSTVPKD